jgi:hypothetical protein
LWKRALVRWDSNTDVLLRRRSKKVLKSFDYDLQAKLDHISDQELQGAGYLNSIFAVLDILAGEKETSERRRVLRAALYEGPRRSDESLAQYALRREAQFMSVTPFINIPDDLKAFMLEERAGQPVETKCAKPQSADWWKFGFPTSPQGPASLGHR